MKVFKEGSQWSVYNGERLVGKHATREEAIQQSLHFEGMNTKSNQQASTETSSAIIFEMEQQAYSNLDRKMRNMTVQQLDEACSLLLLENKTVPKILWHQLEYKKEMESIRYLNVLFNQNQQNQEVK